MTVRAVVLQSIIINQEYFKKNQKEDLTTEESTLDVVYNKMINDYFFGRAAP